MKDRNSKEIAASIVAIFRTYEDAADAVGASVSQIHGWVKGTSDMPGTASRIARRLIADREWRMSMVADFVRRRSPVRPGDPIVFVLDLSTVGSDGERNVVKRELAVVPSSGIAGFLSDFITDTLTDGAWMAGDEHLHFYSQSSEDGTFVVRTISLDSPDKIGGGGESFSAFQKGRS